MKKGVAMDLSTMFSEDRMQNHHSKKSNDPPAHLLQRLQKSASRSTTPQATETSSSLLKESNYGMSATVERSNGTKTSRQRPSISARVNTNPSDPKRAASTEKLVRKEATTQETILVEPTPGFESNPSIVSLGGERQTNVSLVVSKSTVRSKEPVVTVKQELLSHQVDDGKMKSQPLVKARNGHLLKKSVESRVPAGGRSVPRTDGGVTAPCRRDSTFPSKSGTKSRVSLQKNSSFFASSAAAVRPPKVDADADQKENEMKIQWTITKDDMAVEKILPKPTIVKSRLPATIRHEAHDWAGKQCDTFMSWLNYTFQPDDEDDASGPQRTGLRALVIHRRLAQVRFRAAELFRSEDMKRKRSIIQSEIAKGRLSMRSDRDIHADLSLRMQATNLLLSYTTPWLRLGLEVMFGETIFPDSLNDATDNKMVGENC
jgi:hypothetical protein